MAKNFLYRIIFKNLRLCYYGRAESERRYGKNNKLGQQFVGPHHNSEVTALLESGEIAYWVKVKEFDTAEEVKKGEDDYLDKVWASGRLKDRPQWILNRRGSGLPDSPGGWHHKPEAKNAIGVAASLQRGIKTGRQSKEAILSRWSLDYEQIWVDVEEALSNSTGYHWGGAKIAKKHGCSRRFIAGVAKLIREGVEPQEWIPS